MMKYMLCLSLFFLTALLALEDQKVLETISRLEKEHEKVSEEIEHLKKLLGFFPSIDELALIESEKEEDAKILSLLEQAQKEYRGENFEEAKKLYQRAWEKNPNSYVANYNLALSSYRLGNVPFAKTIFKSALALKGDLPSAKELKAFVDGKGPKIVSKEEKAQKALRNEVINLQKKAESYSQSTNLNMQEKTKQIFLVLEEIVEKVRGNKKLIQEFFGSVSDSYAAFEQYSKARDILQIYETAMKGELLASDYYQKKLKIEESLARRQKRLKTYQNHEMDEAIKHKLSRDLHELEIFSAQIDEFAQKAEIGDANFEVICKRLGEYRWGNKQGRHVIIVNRFQELLYSSLEGTVAIDRYRDRLGRSFLKDISSFSKEDGFFVRENAAFFPVDLQVQGKSVPYIVMFSYIPKHQAFIIVRLPRQDLS